jgi:hypothetical protein
MMSMSACLRRCLAAAPLFCLASLALAHHGKDFLFTETLHFSPSGQYFLMANASSLHWGDEDEFEIEPGFLTFFNDAHPFALEIHGHFAKEDGEGLRHEATGVALRTSFAEVGDWAFGGSVEEEFGAGDEPDNTEIRLIAQQTVGTNLLGINVIGDFADGEDDNWGYAAGYHFETLAPLAYGIEAVGSFTDDAHSIIPSVQYKADLNTVLKFGVGIGVSDAAPDWGLHFGVVLKL